MKLPRCPRHRRHLPTAEYAHLHTGRELMVVDFSGLPRDLCPVCEQEEMDRQLAELRAAGALQ